jgi:hypothetical protein
MTCCNGSTKHVRDALNLRFIRAAGIDVHPPQCSPFFSGQRSPTRHLNDQVEVVNGRFNRQRPQQFVHRKPVTLGSGRPPQS